MRDHFKGYLVNWFAISLQGHWAKHLVKWPTPFQSQNLQEPWQHQKTRRRRRRPWRPCSPGWPHSAARGRPAGPSRSFPACQEPAHSSEAATILCVSCTTPLNEHCVLRRFSAHISPSLPRFWDLNGFVLERRGYKCIIFRGIHRSIFWGGRGIGLLAVHHLQEYRQKFLLEERAKESVSPEALRKLELIAWMLRTLSFLSLKHYIKWILINFCFNTLSHRRLSCAVNFQGVCSLKFYVDLGKRAGAIASRTGRGNSAQEASAPRMLFPSLHRCGVEPHFAFCHLFNQKDPRERWLLVLLAGCVYCVRTGVCM